MTKLTTSSGVTVRIPTTLRTLTGGEANLLFAVDDEGSKVGAIFELLEAQCPGFRERLLNEDGSVRRFVNFYVNDEDIRFRDGLETVILGGQTFSIIPAVAGG